MKAVLSFETLKVMGAVDMHKHRTHTIQGSSWGVDYSILRNERYKFYITQIEEESNFFRVGGIADL